jgi:uncharacterized damage-inducible protein DinB
MAQDPLLDNYRLLARYNGWFNRSLYAACEQLAAEERQRERGAFFGSIHRTLNHVVWGDQMWLQRFATQDILLPALGNGLLEMPHNAVYETVLYPEWPQLRAKREQLDAAIESWLAEMPASFPLSIMRYSNMKGITREHPAWQALTHFFNHQTHHRGQVTTLLAQAGIDVGVTDLIALV